MKKLLVVVIIVVIVALLAAYKCSRSRGAEDVETLPETSQPAPAAEPAPAPAAEPAPAPAPAPAAEEQKPVETLPETSQTEQKEPAATPAKEPKKEGRKAKPANADAEKIEKPAEKPAPKAVEEKKPVAREEKSIQERPTPALDRAPSEANIDSAGVTKVINVSKAAIKRCYDKALTSNPMLKGKMSVKITINEQGRVSNTEVVEDSLKDAEVAKCVKGVIGRLRFPKPAGGSASVTFPFAFDPKNQ